MAKDYRLFCSYSLDVLKTHLDDFLKKGWEPISIGVGKDTYCLLFKKEK